MASDECGRGGATGGTSDGWLRDGPSDLSGRPSVLLVVGPSVVLRVLPSSSPVQGFLRKGRVLGSGAGSGQVGLRNHVEPISRLTSPHDTRWRHRQRRVRSSAPTRRRGRPPSSPSRTKYGLAPPVVLHSAPRGPPQRPPVFVSERAIPTRTRDPDAALNRGLIRRSSSREALDALIDSTRPLLSPLLSPLLCALIDALGRLRACCRSARWIRCWRRCAGSTST